MASTSLSLGSHWEGFIRREVSSGRYGSASEVVREGLRALEQRKTRLEALRSHLAVGASEAQASIFVDYDIEQVITGLDRNG